MFAAGRTWFAHLHHHAGRIGNGDIQHDVSNGALTFGFPSPGAPTFLRHFKALCRYTASISRFTRCNRSAGEGSPVVFMVVGIFAPSATALTPLAMLTRGVNIQFVLGGARQGDINRYRPRLFAFNRDQTKSLAHLTDHRCGVFLFR